MTTTSTQRRCLHCAEPIPPGAVFFWVWIHLAGAHAALCPECYRRRPINQEADNA